MPEPTLKVVLAAIAAVHVAKWMHMLEAQIRELRGSG
jgi:hypothetical protein